MPSAKKHSAFAALILVILVSLGAEFYASYSTHPPGGQPRLVLGDLQLRSTSLYTTGLGGRGLNLSLEAVVFNPNAFGATLEGANYSVYADGRYVGAGQTVREYDLAPESSLTLSFPVDVGWRPALETSGSYLLGLGHVTWAVRGTADVEVGGLMLPIQFEFTTT